MSAYILHTGQKSYTDGNDNEACDLPPPLPVTARDHHKESNTFPRQKNVTPKKAAPKTLPKALLPKSARDQHEKAATLPSVKKVSFAPSPSMHEILCTIYILIASKRI